MEYLVRFVQVHENFRRAELEALAELTGVDLEIVRYQPKFPFCVVRVPSEEAARRLIARSILAYGIFELWGVGTDYEELHQDVRRRSKSLWGLYKTLSFRFSVIGFQGRKTLSEAREIIESFAYTGFEGPIVMKNAGVEFYVFEEYGLDAPRPSCLYMARLIAESDRDAITEFDLKKRHYISTTSMDSELALVTANMTHAAPGRLLLDPFIGTGSFPIACAHFGAISLGSDIDGRSIRGKDGRNILSNFDQYKLTPYWMDAFVSDLTHSPLRPGRFLDGIICDPPYGVREGLKVLGMKNGNVEEVIHVNGKPAYLQEGYIPPKRPYSFEAMLDDILHFSARSLVDGGRLSMWMPTANDEEVELSIPKHGCLELVSVCIQPFNKWSRRLLTYRRIPGAMATDDMKRLQSQQSGRDADDLNHFRKKYFQGFKDPAALAEAT